MKRWPAAISLCLLACSQASEGDTTETKQSPATSQAAPAAEQPPLPPVVRDDSKDLVFSWTQAERGYATATSPQQVPECCRKDVVIADLSRSPQERQAHRYVMVADLSQKAADGSYPVVVLSRYRFEGTDLSDPGPLNHDGVTVYSTAWCGFCKKLKRWLDKRGVKYAAKDIEVDPKAGAELQAKLKKAGMQAGGVPVTDIKGTLIKGFAKARIAAALEAQGL